MSDDELPSRLTRFAETLKIDRFLDSSTAPAPAGHEGPLEVLAVSPALDRAWARAQDGRAALLDLYGGSTQVFDFTLRDAAYDPSGSVVAVTGEASDPASLVELHDDAPTDHRPLPLPEPRRIHWPYGQPYRFAAYDLDWDGELRLSSTRHGVALAHVNGTLWVRFADGHQGSWRMPPVYQGWTSAYPHAHGLVVTSVHNGRTGDFVWLDREGVWHDAFDSDWKPVSPCLPTPRGFVAAIRDRLVRFEGFPATITEHAIVGGWPRTGAVDHDLECVVLTFDDRRAELMAEGGPISVVQESGEGFEESWERVADPRDDEPWRFEALDDPELGRIWRPPAERVAALVADLRELHRDDPEAAAEASRRALGQDALTAQMEAAQIEPAVWRALQRWVGPPPSRAALPRIVERLASTPDDPFITHALRSALPEAWRSAGRPTVPAADWIRAHVPRLHRGVAGAQRVVRAEITADPSRHPPWSIVADLDDGTRLRVPLERFHPAALVVEPSEADEETEMFRGVLVRDGVEPQPVVVEVDPWPGYIAYRVLVTSDAGDHPLCTGAEFHPVVLPDPDTARVLAYASEAWPRIYLGRREGAPALSPFADDLDEPQLLLRPAPRPAVVEMLELLVADALLELIRPVDDALGWAVEVALGAAPSLDAATVALEDVLLDHPSVDELFADPEQLRAHIAPRWPLTPGS